MEVGCFVFAWELGTVFGAVGMDFEGYWYGNGFEGQYWVEGAWCTLYCDDPSIPCYMYANTHHHTL